MTDPAALPGQVEEDVTLNLFLVRHAIAHDRDPEQWPDDDLRPLTPEGESRFRLVAADLGKISDSPVRLYSSPLARAWRTAELLHEVAGWPAPEELDVLRPEFPPDEAVAAINRLAEVSFARSFAIVGHRPNLHELASCLLTGDPDTLNLTIKKGGSLCIRFEGAPDTGTGDLRWVMTPKMSLI